MSNLSGVSNSSECLMTVSIKVDLYHHTIYMHLVLGCTGSKGNTMIRLLCDQNASLNLDFIDTMKKNRNRTNTKNHNTNNQLLIYKKIIVFYRV
jgi:hypothetical protein